MIIRLENVLAALVLHQYRASVPAMREATAMQDRIRSLIQELRNRSVIRALVAYSVVCWVLLQVADVTFDRLPIPENSMTVLIALVVIGFPVVAILAWAYELTERGIVRHAEVGERASRLAFLPFIPSSGSSLWAVASCFTTCPRISGRPRGGR